MDHGNSGQGSISISGGTFNNSPVAFKQTIRNAYNTAAQAPNDELKQQLEALTKQMEELLGNVDAETAETMGNDLEVFLKQATAEKLQKGYLSVSADGLIEGAKKIGAVGAPLIPLVQGILKMLGH